MIITNNDFFKRALTLCPNIIVVDLP